MKTKLDCQLFLNRSVFIPTLVLAATLLVLTSSALADPNPSATGLQNPGSGADVELDTYNHPEWEIIKKPSSDLTLDGPTLARRHQEAAAQLQQLERGAPQPQPPTSWTNIGPSRITVDLNSLCNYGAENSGRIVSLAIDPANSSHWLIAADSGGIWQTTDAGGSWSPRTDQQSSMNTDAIAFAPLPNSNIVYASLPLTGLLKSTNGGSSWKQIPTNCDNNGDCFSGRGVRAFIISPNNPNVAVAALEGGSGSSYGIYRTTDGGAHWMQRLSHRATALVSVAGDFTRQYAAIGEPGYEVNNHLFRSTDSGQNWQFVPGPEEYSSRSFSLAFSPTNIATLYVWVQYYDLTNNLVARVFKSTNAWDPNPSNLMWNDLGFPNSSDHTEFGRAITVDPTDPNAPFVGGVDAFKYDSNTSSWKPISGCRDSVGIGTHIDNWEMQWVGTDLLNTNDGGIFLSHDKGYTYESRNSNLSIAQCYYGVLHPTSPGFTLVGVQDNGSPANTGDGVWKQVLGGDGMSPVISVVDPNNDWLVSVSGVGIHRTTDRGATEHTISQGINSTCHPFYARIVGCRSQNVVLAGTNKLWRSDDAFTGNPPTWSSANSPDVGCGDGKRALDAIVFAPSNNATCNTYAIGGPGGMIWATTDGGKTPWKQVGPGNQPGHQLPARLVTDLAFDPQSSIKLYATLDGYVQGGHVYVCNDITAASPSWDDISPFRPTGLRIPHNAIAIDPQHTTHLYVGTEAGLVTSTDGGGSWSSVPSSQIPKMSVRQIQINRTTNKIVAFTYGRGAYSGDLPAAGSPGHAIGWHQERENWQSEALNALLRQPWWVGVGILGTVAVTRSCLRRSRKHKSRT